MPMRLIQVTSYSWNTYLPVRNKRAGHNQKWWWWRNKSVMNKGFYPFSHLNGNRINIFLLWIYSLVHYCLFSYFDTYWNITIYSDKELLISIDSIPIPCSSTLVRRMHKFWKITKVIKFIANGFTWNEVNHDHKVLMMIRTGSDFRKKSRIVLVTKGSSKKCFQVINDGRDFLFYDFGM